MTNHHNSDAELTETAIAQSLETLWKSAQECKNSPIRLLDILRRLENLHLEIRDTLFQESLPDNRQALYVLLKDIEAEGGWPYIYRTKLHELLARMPQDDLEQILPRDVPPASP